MFYCCQIQVQDIFLQVQDMVNKIDDGSGVLDFEDFLLVMILDQ